MWWCGIPILMLSLVALVSYRSGKELKEDIGKNRYNFKGEIIKK